MRKIFFSSTQHTAVSVHLLSLLAVFLILLSPTPVLAETDAPFCSNPLFSEAASTPRIVDDGSGGFSLVADDRLKWQKKNITYSIRLDGVSNDSFKELGVCNQNNTTDSSTQCKANVANYIKPHAEAWEKYGDIELTYIDTWREADIRLAFYAEGIGANIARSTVGTGAESVDKNEQTMHIGIERFKVPLSTEEKFGLFTSDSLNATITHEFGHALGLQHEHQRLDSDATFKYVLEEAITYYLKHNKGLTREKLKGNLEKSINNSNSSFNFLTDYDHASIMHYSIPRSIVGNPNACPEAENIDGKNNEFCISTNFELSQNDKSGFNKLYSTQIDIYDSTNPITGVRVAASRNRATAKKKAQEGKYGELINVDLNKGTKSDSYYIYMAVARDPQDTPLIGITTASSLNGCPSGWDLLSMDLNKGAEGDFIYFCTLKQSKYNYGPPIEDINIGYSPTQFRDGGFTVTLTKASAISLAKKMCLNNIPNAVLVNKDLNAGAGGDYIYTCYTPAITSILFLDGVENEPEKIAHLCNKDTTEAIKITQLSKTQDNYSRWYSRSQGTIAPSSCKDITFNSDHNSAIYYFAHTASGKQWPAEEKYTDKTLCVKDETSWSFAHERSVDECKDEGGFIVRGAEQHLITGTNVVDIKPKLQTYTLQTAVVPREAGTGGKLITVGSSDINCEGGTSSPGCSATLPSGILQDVVTLQAVPNAISNFTGWGNKCTPVQGEPLKCTLQMTEDRIIAGVFTKKPILIVDKIGNGVGRLVSDQAGIDCGSSCIYELGGTIEISAEPDANSAFTKWSGIGSQGCSNDSSSCQVTIDSFKYLMAEFSRLPSNYDLNVNVTGTGEGRVTDTTGVIDCGEDCNEPFPRQTEFSKIAVISLQPVVEPGSVFTGWGGACSGKWECTVRMTEARTVTANFSISQAKTIEVATLDETTLRQAVFDANNNPGSDIIKIPSTLSGRIPLTTGAIKITDALIFTGPGADQLTIDAGKNSIVFDIATGALENVAISGVTITGGFDDGNGSFGGGAVSIGTGSGDVVISNSVLSDNVSISGGGGGAIRKHVGAGSLTVISTALINNSSIDENDEYNSNDGGAIRNDEGLLTIINSTISDNKARMGGGIYSPKGTLTIQNSTITENSSLYGGGGINSSGNLTFSNSIIAGNIATSNKEIDSFIFDSEEVISQGHNIIGENGQSGVSDASMLIETDIILAGSLSTVVDKLADNGGQTPTLSLNPDGPAIDSGSNAFIPEGIATDQRGKEFSRVVNGIVDIGAMEHYFEIEVLSITQKGPDTPVTEGTTYTYELTVANHKASATENVEVSILLAEGLELIGVSGSGWVCIEEDRLLRCMKSQLAGKTNSTILMQVKALPGISSISNQASVFSTETETVTGNNSATEITAVEANRSVDAIIPIINMFFLGD